MDATGTKTCAEIVGTNLDYGVTWVHSYVTPERPRPTASTTRPAPKPSARAPRRTTSRSTGSPRSGSWTRTSTLARGACPDAAGPTGTALRRSYQGSSEHSHPRAAPRGLGPFAAPARGNSLSGTTEVTVSASGLGPKAPVAGRGGLKNVMPSCAADVSSLPALLRHLLGAS